MICVISSGSGPLFAKPNRISAGSPAKNSESEVINCVINANVAYVCLAREEKME